MGHRARGIGYPGPSTGHGQTAPESWSGEPPAQLANDSERKEFDVAAEGNSKLAARDAHGRSERREEGERLQKALSRAGLASRREVEEWIRAGRITVNGELAVLGVRVGPSDHVRLDGRLIRQRQTGGAARVFLIHRSPGENLQQPAETSDQSASDGSSELSEGADASEGTRGSPSPSSGTPVLDRIPRRAGRRFIAVSPMPRVDGGLELVTSDGDLASKLQRSMRRLSSEFSVRVHGELSSQGLETIVLGELDNGEKLEIERCEAAGGEGSNRWYSLVARGASGKDVRQLFERQGALVSRVLRTQLGSLALDRHLSRGRFRELSPEELQALLATAENGTA
jgi:23S rRNA pseudouridine2605 synthase